MKKSLITSGRPAYDNAQADMSYTFIVQHISLCVVPLRLILKFPDMLSLVLLTIDCHYFIGHVLLKMDILRKR